jgi:hypothetical protein
MNLSFGIVPGIAAFGESFGDFRGLSDMRGEPSDAFFAG